MRKFFIFYRHPSGVLSFGVAGIMAGVFFPAYASFFQPMGEIFIKLIKMLVIPIIFFSILSSTLKIRQTRGKSTLGLKMIGYVLVFYLLSATLTIFVSQFLPQEISLKSIPKEFLEGDKLITQMPKAGSISEFILNLIPENLFQSGASGNLLQILVFTLFLGIALAYYEGEGRKGVEESIHTLSSVLGWMMDKIMILSPLAVFGLLYFTMANLGAVVLLSMLHFFLLYLILILFWTYGVLALCAKFIGGISYKDFVKTLFPLQILALGTSSSLVCLPLNIKSASKLGEASLVNVFIPLGTTLNLQATVMYYLLSAFFFANLFQIPLDTTAYMMMAITAILGASAAAGIPGTSLMIAGVYVAGGIPLSALPLLFASDRLFDMVVTTGNVTGNYALSLFLKKNRKS